MGFIIRGFIWDIPIPIFAYVLFWGPIVFPEPKTETQLGRNPTEPQLRQVQTTIEVH